MNDFIICPHVTLTQIYYYHIRKLMVFGNQISAWNVPNKDTVNNVRYLLV